MPRGSTLLLPLGLILLLAACGESETIITACPEGQVMCSEACVDTTSDRANCGGCADGGGEVCGAGEICAGGVCSTSCPEGQVVCGGACVDTTSDRAHCGGCADGGGEVCDDGEICAGGVCVISCPTGQIACEGFCVDPLTDSDHCGGCADAGGQVCELQEVCREGACVADCALMTPSSYALGLHALGLDWSADGDYLATGGDRMSNPAADDLQVWAFDGAGLSRVTGATLMIQGISPAWAPDGSWLAYGGSDAALSQNLAAYGFDGASLSQVDVESPSAIKSLAMHPGGNFVAAGSFSGDLQVWSFDGTSYAQAVSDYIDQPINQVAWSPDGNYLAVAADSDSMNDSLLVYAWNGTSPMLLDGRTLMDDATCLAWSPDGSLLLVGFEQGLLPELQVLGFDGATLSDLASADTATDVLGVDWSPDGSGVVAVGENLSGDLDLLLFDFDGSSLSLDTEGSKNLGPLTCAAFHPDGAHIAAAGTVVAGQNNLFLVPVCAP